MLQTAAPALAAALTQNAPQEEPEGESPPRIV